MKINFNKAGLFCSILHFVIVGIVLLGISEESRIWIWMQFLIIDFPISLLSTGGIDLMINIWGEPPFSTDWKISVYDNWPGFVHLVFGTVWWYFIPVLLGKLFNKIFLKKTETE